MVYLLTLKQLRYLWDYLSVYMEIMSFYVFIPTLDSGDTAKWWNLTHTFDSPWLDETFVDFLNVPQWNSSERLLVLEQTWAQFRHGQTKSLVTHKHHLETGKQKISLAPHRLRLVVTDCVVIQGEKAPLPALSLRKNKTKHTHTPHYSFHMRLFIQTQS